MEDMTGIKGMKNNVRKDQKALFLRRLQEINRGHG
jgi:hypothetical protein